MCVAYGGDGQVVPTNAWMGDYGRHVVLVGEGLWGRGHPQELGRGITRRFRDDYVRGLWAGGTLKSCVVELRADFVTITYGDCGRGAPSKAVSWNYVQIS